MRPNRNEDFTETFSRIEDRLEDGFICLCSPYNNYPGISALVFLTISFIITRFNHMRFDTTPEKTVVRESGKEPPVLHR